MGRPSRVMIQDFVTYRTGPADTARERARLWWAQALLAAALGAGTVGLTWLAVSLGGGAGVAGSVIAAALAPVALGSAPAAWLASRTRRRLLLAGSAAAAALALVTAVSLGPDLRPGLIALFALGLGTARVAFDGAAADVLHHLVEPARRPAAAGDLTARFGRGQFAGLALALGVGLAAGPRGAAGVAAGLAAAAALVAAGHHRDLDIRVAAMPLALAVRAGAREAWRDPVLGRTLAAGAVGVALGSAQAAMLIVWLRDGVGLRGALAPALLAGLLAIRLARPALVRLASGSHPRHVLAMAFALQAAGSLAAYRAGGAAGAAAAYALVLGAGACLAVLVNRVRQVAGPPDLAPAVGLAGGAAWALAGCAGAAGGGLLAALAGVGDAHLVLAALASAAAVAAVARADRSARVALQALAAARRD